MTLAEIRSEVFRRLSAVEADEVFWTAEDVDRSINEGYAEVSDAAEWDERSASIALTGDRYLDAREEISHCVLTIGPAFNTTTNRWLRRTRPRELDDGDRRWSTAQSQPQHIIIRGLWWIGYWPYASTGEIVQRYTTLPDVLLSDEAEPGFPDPFHYALVEYALYDLWSQDAESDRALAAWTAYVAYEAGLTDWVQSRLSAPMVHGFAPALR